MRAQLAHPVTAAILAAIAPIAGAWLALRKTQILQALKQIFPTEIGRAFWDGYGDLAIFVILFLILLIGFTFHKKAESSITKERHAQLDTAVTTLNSEILNIRSINQAQIMEAKTSHAELGSAISALNNEIELIRTIGLKKIGKVFEASIVKVQPLHSLMYSSGVTQEQIAEAAKTITTQIIYLAKALDLNPPETTYSASVFLYWPMDALNELSHSGWEELRKQIEFRKYISVERDDLSGILRHYHDFSTSYEKKGQNGSGRLTLPVHTSDNPHDRTRLLPGAPLCAATNKSVIMRDLKELEDWCNDNADYTVAGINEIMRFFKDRPINSFIAIPLKDDFRVVGVLCIERSSDGIFQGSRFDTASSLLSPLLIPLGGLLSRYMKNSSIND